MTLDMPTSALVERQGACREPALKLQNCWWYIPALELATKK